MSNSVFQWNQSKIKALRDNSIRGLLAMGFEISRWGKDNAPWLFGDLSRSIRTTTEGDTVYVLAGGNVNGKSIAYARRREYENNAHPDKRYYMRRAYETVVRGNYQSYFREVTR